MKRFRFLLLSFAAVCVLSAPAAAQNYAACYDTVTGTFKVCPGNVRLKSGFFLQSAYIPTGIDALKIGSGTVNNTVFGYLSGVTSDIQTQLNGKQATLTLPLSIANGGTGASSWNAHEVLIGPTSGGAAAPTRRILTGVDIPWPDAPLTDLVFTASGTYTIPTEGKTLCGYCIGEGGGGGSGRRGTANAFGGGAGSGGSHSGQWCWLKSELGVAGGTLDIVVNAGGPGTGGAAVSTDDTDGNAGAGGGGSFIIIPSTSTIILYAGGGLGGQGGTAASGTGGSTFVNGMFLGSVGGNGGAGNGSEGISSGTGASGGGGGGGYNGGDTTGGAGGTRRGLGYQDTSGAQLLGFGGVSLYLPGTGGAGGNQTGGVGGAGGNGGLYGGGGGGGSGSNNGNPSGAGGNGGTGMCRLRTF